MFPGDRLSDRRGKVNANPQRREVFLREAILLITPLVKAHATVVRTRLATKKCHAVLRRSVTCPHNVPPTPRRKSAIDSTNAPGGILLLVVSDVESDDWTLAVRGCTFDDHNLGYLPVLAKIVVGTQRRDQLG